MGYKNLSDKYGILLKSWSNRPQGHNTIQAIAIPFGCIPELADKTQLLPPCMVVARYREMEPELS